MGTGEMVGEERRDWARESHSERVVEEWVERNVAMELFREYVVGDIVGFARFMGRKGRSGEGKGRWLMVDG